MTSPDISALHDIYTAALNGVGSAKPRNLLTRANTEAQDEHDVSVDIEDLKRLIADPGGDKFLQRLRLALGTWDAAEPTPTWSQDTQPRTLERRARSYQLLGVTDIAEILDKRVPISKKPVVVITLGRVEPWYPPADLDQHEFYWPHYRDFLLDVKGWDGEAVAKLDEATSEVVKRIANPAVAGRYASRGLVIGHVQSGKTANFTGCIAKAIDAGYRLVIVLAGTLENLRRQTQRRLDQELVGVENIITTDPDEYVSDGDWPDAWVTHKVRPSEHNYPDIIRLTTHEDDYRELNQGIRALELSKQDRTKPLWDPVNLYRSDAIVVVVKKQQDRLDALIRDLAKVKDQLGEIPALVLDDESDQASINTVNIARLEQGDPTRTAINERITNLLKVLPRGQYVGYTATPYANVLVNPDDAADLFPQDFIVSLNPPPAYMGLAHFQRQPTAPELPGIHPSDIVRFLTGGGDLTLRGAELAGALDAFVLTAAIKLYRQRHSASRYRHHTMLVHETVRISEHRQLADQIGELWQEAEFTTSRGLARLERLWQTDFAPVSRHDAPDQANPATFDELRDLVGLAIGKITDGGQQPYIIVNGDPDIEREDVAFDQHDVWRILIGGASLSRGFTVEGLTITYYRRRAGAGDTTMQMGRWFGYRPGYRDLVRLYIGTNEPGPRDTTVDLFEQFEAVLADEDAFRGQLAKYSEEIEESDGEGGVIKRFRTPRDVLPLVSQHLAALPPTSASKRRNAVAVRTDFNPEPNRWSDQPEYIAANYARLVPIAAAAQENTRVAGSNADFYTGTVTHEAMTEALRHIAWLSGEATYWSYEMEHLEAVADQIADWIVLVPQGKDNTKTRFLPGIGRRTLHKRGRRSDRGNSFGYISGRVEREAVIDLGNELNSDRGEKGHGVALVYPIYPENIPGDNDDNLTETVILALYLLLPPQAATSRAQVVYRARTTPRSQ